MNRIIGLAAAAIAGIASTAAGEPKRPLQSVEQLAAKVPQHLLSISDLHQGVDFAHEAIFKNDGSEPDGNYQDGELTEGASKYLSVHIPDGEDIWFNLIAVCDDNCAGISLDARNAAGETAVSSTSVARDMADISFLSTDRAVAGQLPQSVLKNTDEVIGIHMVTCKATACKYSIRMYKVTNADFLQPVTEGILRQACAHRMHKGAVTKTRGLSAKPDVCRHR